jgi:hypothetical protein
MMFVLGTFVVKGFTSVGPSIKTDGIEINSDYSCDQIDLLSGKVMPIDLNISTNVGNYVVTNAYAINTKEDKELDFTLLEIDYLPDLQKKNTINTISAHNTKVIAGGSGGLPYTKYIILATNKIHS